MCVGLTLNTPMNTLSAPSPDALVTHSLMGKQWRSLWRASTSREVSRSFGLPVCVCMCALEREREREGGGHGEDY